MSLRELLEETKWLSLFQLSIFHSGLLFSKVKIIGKPDRLLRRCYISTDSEARMLLTERVGSTKSEYYKSVME